MRDYWLDRLSLDEIRELGGCLDSLVGSEGEYAAWDS